MAHFNWIAMILFWLWTLETTNELNESVDFIVNSLVYFHCLKKDRKSLPLTPRTLPKKMQLNVQRFLGIFYINSYIPISLKMKRIGEQNDECFAQCKIHWRSNIHFFGIFDEKILRRSLSFPFSLPLMNSVENMDFISYLAKSA